MNASDALDRLDQIHDHLTRAEVYRGFRVPAVFAVGVAGVLAAAVQPLIPSAADGLGFVWYWVGIACACGSIGTVAAVRSYLLREDELDRRQTRRVMGQFLPCVVVGAAITAGVMRHGPELIPLLPGVWAAVFGLGIIATRPFVPPAVGAVGVWYLLVGVALVLQLASLPSHWAVGGVFGLGHFATAWILWRDLGEDDDE